MVKASAKWKEGEQFTGEVGGHSLLIDSDRGTNLGPGPMDLVLTALCACMATDIVIILKKKREPFTSLEVHAEGERASDPPRVFTHIKLLITVGGAVTTKAVEDAVRLSEEKYCSVSGMVQKTAKIVTEVRYRS